MRVTARTRVAVLVALAAAVALVAGATGGRAAVQRAHGTVTIKMLVGVAETAALEQKAKDEVALFEKQHPGIKIDREAIGNDQLRTIIQTRGCARTTHRTCSATTPAPATAACSRRRTCCTR